jgi:hypothetical protein
MRMTFRVMVFALGALAVTVAGCGDAGNDEGLTETSGALRVAASEVGRSFSFTAVSRTGDVAMFKGEIVGIEPLFESGGEVGLVLRASGALELAGTGSAFDGKYLVAGVSHRFGAGTPGYHTLLSLTGPDGGQFMLPEVDDEVLVAFAEGDSDRPIIVGTVPNPAR